MLRALYDWTLSLAGHRHALWALAIVSFVESSVFPIPPDILMIPMIIAAPRKAWLIAGVCTISSVLGGLLGYYIGYALFDVVGQPVLEAYGKMDLYNELKLTYDSDVGFWAVFVAGITPLPYKLFTILSGTLQFSVVPFVMASIVARGLRFFIVAALLWKFGEPIRDFIEKRLGLMFILFVALLIGGFLVLGAL
ncbi:MAG: YqaA family protein [Pseudomonadota bacterium]